MVGSVNLHRRHHHRKEATFLRPDAQRSCGVRIDQRAHARQRDPAQRGEGLVVAQPFVHENRVRQAAASAGAARYCTLKALEYAKTRVAFGEPLAATRVNAGCVANAVRRASAKHFLLNILRSFFDQPVRECLYMTFFAAHDDVIAKAGWHGFS